MSLIDDKCCPGESGGSMTYGGVADAETLVVAVRLATHYRLDPAGQVVLTYNAISAADLKGRGDDRGRRGVSFERKTHCQPSVLLERIRRITKEEDPVSASVKAEDLRAIRDTNDVRELCIHSEPTGDEDPFGPSETHGAFRSRDGRPEPPAALTWMDLRIEIAKRFGGIVRMVSGKPPLP